MSQSLSDKFDISKSLFTSMIIHSKTILSRSDQNDILYFDKINIFDFLCRWDIECEDYNLFDKKKYARIIDYCSSEIQKIIEILEDYIESN